MLGLGNEVAIRTKPDYRDRIQTAYTKASQESLLSYNSIGIRSLVGISNDRVLDNFLSRYPILAPWRLHRRLLKFPYMMVAYRTDGDYKIFVSLKKLYLHSYSKARKFTLDAINFDTIKRLGVMLKIENNVNFNEWAHEAEYLFLTSNYYLSLEFLSWDIHWRSLIVDRPFEYTSYTLRFTATITRPWGSSW